MKNINIIMADADADILNDYLQEGEMEGVFNAPFTLTMQDLLDNADIADIQPLPKATIKALNIER